MIQDASRSHDLSERLVRRAAGSAPRLLRERLEEEWLADLQTRQGPVSRLRFALGCHWASRVIAIEQPTLALAGAGSGGRLSLDVAPGAGRRTSSLLLVVGAHALLFYAGWTSLSQTHKATTPPPLELNPIPPATEHPFHPESNVDITQVRVTVPPNEPPPLDIVIDNQMLTPEVLPDLPPDGGGISPKDPLPPPHVPVRVSGAPAAGFPNVDDYYPASAIRGLEQGATAVRVCVNPQGRLEADPATVQSSGFASLDTAALKLAKAGSGHYRPTTEDGHAVSSCFAYMVRFQIKNVR